MSAAFIVVRLDNSQPGKGRALVRCSCGDETWAYVWSWAGHGRRRCPACGAVHVWAAKEQREVGA